MDLVGDFFFVGKLTVVEVIVMKEIKLIIRGNFGKSTDLNSLVCQK